MVNIIKKELKRVYIDIINDMDAEKTLDNNDIGELYLINEKDDYVI